MEKEFCTYTQALRLKELGFDEPCLGFYDGKGDTKVYFNNKRDASGDFIPFVKNERLTWFGAPTFSQAFRWFRNTHDLACYIYRTNFTSYEWVIDIDEAYAQDSELDYTSYEKAELACLEKLLEIVESKSE